MEVMSTTTNEPVYFAWEDYDKKRSAWKKLDYFIGCYLTKYNRAPTQAILSVVDHQAIMDRYGGGLYRGVFLSPRHYNPRGVFRLALPEEAP